MNTLPESNPFTDPSVTKLIDQHHPSAADSAAGIVRNFNPFVEEIGTKREVGLAVGPTNQEIVETATHDLIRQQESLDRAANRLESYQPDLQIQTVIQSARIHNNYPPLPPCCPVRPCFYQNISEEIPQQFQRIVRFHVYFLNAYWIHLFINALGCLAWLIVVEDKGKFVSGFSFVMSIAYLFLLAPCSYVCWFRPLYTAFSGWINGYRCFAVNRYYVGIFMFVIAIIFDAFALIGFILMARVNNLYRQTGASFDLAKQELGQRITSNQMVQETANEAARGATR